jgi:hypothetical protein
MIPTRELKERHRPGHFVRTTQKGSFISQKSWDEGYANNWHQGSAGQATGPEVGDYVHITGNYIENAD